MRMVSDLYLFCAAGRLFVTDFRFFLADIMHLPPKSYNR
jgi:hypothetical protein